MAHTITVENVDVAKVMSAEGAAEALEKVGELIEANPVSRKLLEAAQTVEDAYQVFKDYVEMKWEDFKIVFRKTVDYFREPKAALPDDMLDSVVGGGWSDFWNKYKHKIIRASIIVGCIAGGIALGALTGGAAGAVVFGLVGAAVGYGGVLAYEYTRDRSEG